jgi:hypothetical protein
VKRKQNMDIRKSLGVSSTLIIAAFAGCMGGSGNTDGGSGRDPGYRDDVFVSDETTTGSLRVEVEEPELAVGATSGFLVWVKDSEGRPVQNINVACDSERGLAILEPTTGFELTDSSGSMSGRIGCESPGSFQMVCRVSVGANRRKFVGVKCRGDVPSGFDGFPGAGGGGLGGGVAQDGDSGDVTIVAMGFEDGGATGVTPGSPSSNASIDIFQESDCDGVQSTVDPERFFDTYVNLEVENNLTEDIRFSYLTYSVRNVDGQGTAFQSKQIGLTSTSSSSVSGNGGTTGILVPIFKAAQGGKYVGDPSGVGIRITQVGFRTVSVTLYGQTASGKRVEITARSTASFSNFDRCS